MIRRSVKRGFIKQSFYCKRVTYFLLLITLTRRQAVSLTGLILAKYKRTVNYSRNLHIVSVWTNQTDGQIKTANRWTTAPRFAVNLYHWNDYHREKLPDQRDRAAHPLENLTDMERCEDYERSDYSGSHNIVSARSCDYSRTVTIF